MTYRIVNESGVFRQGEEGVFSGDKCIFIAPPPHMVSGLMNDLISWMKRSEGVVHPLILSAVFHYEFVFIHPFADGNGRMARLWHTVILYQWRNIFEYIPLESQIERFQTEYYDAIAQCHVNGNSDVFIEFMLDMEALGLKSKEALRKNYIKPAIELGLIRMTLPDKPNSKNQRYIKQ